MEDKTFKVIIAGSRNFDDYETLKKYCDHVLRDKDSVEIVCGMANGADLLGKKYAEEKGFKVAKFPANWTKHGRAAGYIRNADMADYADAAIVFWDEKSKGSKHMIDLSEKANIELRVFRYENKEWLSKHGY